MDENCFQDCLKYWKKSVGNQPFWQELANEYGYESGEILRSRFKRERQRRGIYRDQETFEVKQDFSNFPEVAVIDIEVLPGKGYMFGLYDQNIGINQIIEDDCFLSWAGKKLNGSEIYSDILTPKEAINRDTSRITESVHNFIAGCDVVIGHNWKGYDGKMLNNYFLLNNKYPLRYQVIDTLEISRSSFRWLSNKLAYINKKLGIRNKIETEGFGLWERAGRGVKEALRTMLEYNIGDVLSEEELYYKIRPFAPNHINLSLYNDIEEEQCPCCLSQEFTIKGTYPSGNSRYETLRCNNCGSLNRRRTNLLSKDKRKSLLARL